MQPLIMVVHILTCVSIVVLVLIQHGKGADVGATFGSGASNTVFGSRGSTSFLFKLTAVFATLFFATSITLSYLAMNRPNQETALDLLDKGLMKLEQHEKTSEQVVGSSAESPTESTAGSTNEPSNESPVTDSGNSQRERGIP